jgi:ATP-dependent DNA helicase RecG
MTLRLDTPVADLHRFSVAGLSSVMCRRLAAEIAGYVAKSEVGAVTVEDLLSYLPLRYEDRSNLLKVDELVSGVESSVELVVRVSGGYKVGKNRSPKAPPLFIFEITASDPEFKKKPVVIWWFVSGKAATHTIAYYAQRYGRGSRLIAYGKWDWDTRRNTMALRIAKPDELELLPMPPDVEEAASGSAESSGPSAKGRPADDLALEEDSETAEFATIHTGRKVPVYRKLGPFQTKRLREIVFAVLEQLGDVAFQETLPPMLLSERGLIPRSDAVRQMHFPPEGTSISDYALFRSAAHRRMIFEEFFWAAFALLLKRGERVREAKGASIEVGDATRAMVDRSLPFELTGAQKRVVAEILADMQSDSPMNRLVQGDVGSGKTVVAFVAALVAAENGYQSTLMAPTEILAEQHLRNASAFFAATPYKVGLLTGSMKAAEKRRVREELRDGELHLLVGTHAVIQEGVEFSRLGLAIIDEQHRFGVLQRAQLRAMGFNPDVLVMTATPIPRSLAMTVYGDLDVSVIDELPPGRTPVKTVVVGEDQRSGVYKGIRREIELGRQAYVVYPLIEESEKVDLKAATKMFEEMRDEVFPDVTVGLLHGKMKAGDKEKIMSDFKSGELKILVSTTVIEVGVDVPNASLMVIEHAERFGLSQLHQLRGRVGRGSEKSYCVLLTGDKRTAVARERLGIMEETNDGFKIAEKDLELRGQGDILGTRQSGVQMFRVGNIVRDLEILEEARSDAEFFLGKKRSSAETMEMVRRAESDPRLRLADIG